jgi:hypothetical protein
MTVVVEKKMAENKQEQNTTNPSLYGCEVLLEKTTLQQTKDSSYPTDAYIVSYTLDEKDYIDLCRAGRRVSVFDFYYDKYGPDTIKSIEWGYGRVSPRSWGYAPPEKKRRK